MQGIVYMAVDPKSRTKTVKTHTVTTISSGTSMPFCMYSWALFPESVPAATSARNKSPAEICVNPYWALHCHAQNGSAHTNSHFSRKEVYNQAIIISALGFQHVFRLVAETVSNWLNLQHYSFHQKCFPICNSGNFCNAPWLRWAHIASPFQTPELQKS